MNLRKVLCLYWQAGDTLGEAMSGTLRRLGCQVEVSLHGFPFPEGSDVVVTYGPMGRLGELRQQLLSIPTQQRPDLVFWQTEQFPNPTLPVWLVRFVADWLAPRQRYLTKRGNRFRYLGELRNLQQEGLLTVLGVTSDWTKAYLGKFGLNAIRAYVGHCPEWGNDLGMERDIPVLWLGRIGSTRRARLLGQVRDGLRDRGIQLYVVDGVEHAPVLGKERTILLNRTQIVLNLMRQPWDDNSMRFFLATANGAMVVSEPTLKHTPFMAGIHLVESKVTEMADAICHYLKNEHDRQRTVSNAWRLVSEQLTMENSLKILLGNIRNR